MNTFNSRQRKIASIAANTAAGDLETLKTELNAGLDAGLTVNQIKEILVQMYAYCGFPRSLQGLNTFMAVMDERARRGIQDEAGMGPSHIDETGDKYARGRVVLEELTRTSQAAKTGANAFAPAIDQFLKEHLFADIFGRDVLTYRQRELATVSALAAMEGVEPMLNAHLAMAKNTGLTDEQLAEAITIARAEKPAPKNPVVQLAKIEIDPARAAEYRKALTAEIAASVRVEPGVVGLYAVADRENPASINILEVYADEDAYKSHIASNHFLKYKADTEDIVKKLELVPSVPLIFGGSIGTGHNGVFPMGNSGPAKWFTGEVHVQSLVDPADMENLYSVGQVTFEPGGRTHWHTHPIGQTLLVLEGRGFYQERGKPAQVLTKGSVVPIPKDVEHWHGASADTKLVHIAISNIENGSNVTWMSPVDDEEYAEVNENN